jgi:hypothetical protein
MPHGRDESVGRGARADAGDATSEVARLAVAALAAGRARTVDDAIEAAFEQFARSTHRTPSGSERAASRPRRPSRALLRAHAQALEESEHGPLSRHLRREACLDECLALLAKLEETVLAHDPDGAVRPAPTVHGRAALGHFDLDPVVHARVVTSLPLAALAATVVEAGFDEPHCGSVATRLGRLDELAFDGEHASYRVRRIPPAIRADPQASLTSGARTPCADFAALGRLFAPFGA